jgi:molybdopterin molybdotransferase
VPTTHSAFSWPSARELAYSLAESGAVETVSLGACDKRVSAVNFAALTDLPFADSSSMDGWAVNGSGPWTLTDDHQLNVNQASVVTTGAAIPLGTWAIVRTEHGTLAGNQLTSESPSADDIRKAGEECTVGEQLCAAGVTLNPALIGLLASTGHDQIHVFVQPKIQIIITGDELLTGGLPSRQRVRDSLGIQVPMWLQRMGAHVLPVLYVKDQVGEIAAAITGSLADIVVTTGGTAASAKDHFTSAVARAPSEMLIEGVAVRPGHPMKLAVVRSSTGAQIPIVGLPGNPLAAIVALATLVQPLINKLLGQQLQVMVPVTTCVSLEGGKSGTRLVPGSVVNGAFTPAEFRGSAMLRGLSASTGFAVITTAVDSGDVVDWLPLPI